VRSARPAETPDRPTTPKDDGPTPAVTELSRDGGIPWNRPFLTTDHRFVFIRSVSAPPFILGALNPHDGSSSSSLTSTNVSLLISPQPEKRKVAARRAIRRGARTFLARRRRGC
jgi:hypothetical protein